MQGYFHVSSNWFFAGSLRAGQRAATIMSLIQSAKLNGHDPYRYLKDILERLPTQITKRLKELLPHRWPRAYLGREMEESVPNYESE
jgi:transposase